MRPKPKDWASESEMLCFVRDTFRGWGAKVYGEAAGHDLVIEMTEDCLRAEGYHRFASWKTWDVAAGDVVAVEGKLRANFKVLQQSIPPDHVAPYNTRSGRACDFYCVAVPAAPEGFTEVAAALGIGVILVTNEVPAGSYNSRKDAALDLLCAAQRCVGFERPKLPTLDVEVVPGLPSPMPLTAWKVAAVELCLLAARRPLTRKDFTSRNINARRFTDYNWMRCEGRGDQARWTLSFRTSDRPDCLYRDIAAAVLARGLDIDEGAA